MATKLWQDGELMTNSKVNINIFSTDFPHFNWGIGKILLTCLYSQLHKWFVLSLTSHSTLRSLKSYELHILLQFDFLYEWESVRLHLLYKASREQSLWPHMLGTGLRWGVLEQTSNHLAPPGPSSDHWPELRWTFLHAQAIVGCQASHEL